MGSVSENLKKLGITIPSAPAPVAAYLPARKTGNLVYASGQTPTAEGKLLWCGKVGSDLTVQEGYKAARLAALNCLAELDAVLGSLERVEKIVKLNGYVNSADGFGDQPKIVDGASDLLEAVFGEAGRHARTSIGVYALPGGAPVEIELIVEVKPG